MKLQRSTLASALGLGLALGVAGNASADIHAGSALAINSLSIAFLDANGDDASALVNIRNFNFSLTNTALMNGIGGANGLFGANCGGTQASNTCGVAPTLDANAANAQGSALIRANNDFTMFGIGGGNWSNSDTIINTSELTDGVPTSTKQIAESNLNSAQSAQANTDINSTTGLTFQATLGAGVRYFFFEMFADPDMIAEIVNDLGISQAVMAVSVDLSKDNAFSGVKWTMDGLANDASCITNLTGCDELFDDANLNQTIGVSTNNSSATNVEYNPNVQDLKRFSILVDGLSAGDWTLTLSAKTSTNTIRQVPEPSALALVGIALAGLGFMSRRRKH